MALIRYGSLVDKVSGALGGAVFRSSRAGHHVTARKAPSPKKVRSGASGRCLLSRAAADWRALTAAQQQVWEQMAHRLPQSNRVRQFRFRHGRQLFIQLDILELLAEQSALTTCPPLLTWPLTCEVQIEQTSEQLNATWSVRLGSTDSRFWVYGARTHRPGHTRNTRHPAQPRGSSPRWHFLHSYVGPPNNAERLLTTYFAAQLGAPQAYEIIGVKFVSRHDSALNLMVQERWLTF